MFLFITLAYFCQLVLAVELPSAANCTGQCRTAYDKAFAYDSSWWVVDDLAKDPFWQVPTNLTGVIPGDILKWEHVDSSAADANWTIPGGSSLARFVYVTEDMAGKYLPATAFVLLPFARPSSGSKLRTILWAHGTAGVASVCAPSNHRSLYYDWSAPYAFVQAGYAVVAPDYTGLGLEIPQGFMYEAGWAHAADAAYSIVAARKVIGDWLSEEWVAIGQSEGGLTTWRLNQRLAGSEGEALQKAGKLIGAVSIAPALRPTDYIHDVLDVEGLFAVAALLSAYIMNSITGLYPKFQLEHYLTEDGLSMLRYATKNGCSNSGISAFAGVTKASFFKNASWWNDPAVIDWRFTYNGAGRPLKIAVPMLVVQGSTDLLVSASNTLEDIEQLHASDPGISIQYHQYEGQDHDLVTGSAQKEYLAWVKDRFDGLGPEPGFTSTTMHNLTDNFYPMMRAYDRKAYA